MKYIKENERVFKTWETSSGSIVKSSVSEFELKLSTDKNTIIADGLDIATVTAKIYNYENIYQVGKDSLIIFSIGAEELQVQAVNGQASIEVSSDVPGVIEVKARAEGVREGAVSIEAN